MNFLRENIILVVIVAVTLVGSIVLASAISASGDAADAGLAARVEQNDRLKSSRKQEANEQIIKDERIWVQTIKRNAERLKTQEIKENKKGCELLTFTLTDASDEGPRNLFPVTDEKLFDKHATLPWQITKTYGVELQAILARLKPTAVPTEAEIEEELSNIERRLANEQRKKGGLGNKTTDRNAVREPRNSRGQYGGPPMLPRGMRGLSFPRGGFSSKAPGRSGDQGSRGKARDNAIVRKAKQGRIYADMASLDVVFFKPQFDVKWTELWWSQVNLWITGDIIDAIAATNDQVLSQLEEEDNRNVINSPVKRLISLKIDQKYYTGGKVGTIGGTSRRSSGPSPGGPRGFGGPGGFVLPGSLSRRSSGKPATKSAGSGETLTGHASTTEYDVVMYKFSVVTAVRHLPLLLRNLQTGNRHTVLTLVMDSVDSAKGGDFYYSNESIMRVTIQGEARFLTAWERGTKAGTSGEGFAALMPAEVLKTIPQSALRSEDKQRTGSARKPKKSARKSKRMRRGR